MPVQYIDDIFLLTKYLKETFENNLILYFIYELNINNKIPFLNILFDMNTHNSSALLSKRLINKKLCLLNCKSEYLHKY